MSVSQSNRLQPPTDDYGPRYPPSSPPYRQPPARYPDTHPVSGPEQPYRRPPSDIGDRRDYRDLPEYGRNGYRGNGSLPRDHSLQYPPPSGRPGSAQPDQFHPHPPYMPSSRGPQQLSQPHYSNGSYNGPAPVIMESPPRPGMNRGGRNEPDDRDRTYQQTVSANQQYERVSAVTF